MLTTQMRNAFDGLLSRVNMAEETLNLRIWQETLPKLKTKKIHQNSVQDVQHTHNGRAKRKRTDKKQYMKQ